MKRTLHIFLACVGFTLFGRLQAQTIYPIQWTNVVGATANADQSLTKTGANGWTSGAVSTNLLRAGADGQVQFTYTGPSTTYYMVGLSRTDKDVNYNTIEYGIAYSSGVVSVIQSGSSLGTFGAPQPNEVFKVVRTGNTVYYYRSSVATPMAQTVLSNIYNTTFLVDVSVYSGTMPVVQASFDVALKIDALVTPVSYGGNGGGVSVTVGQGTGPYTYSWDSGETTNSITNKMVGTYTVTVTDAVGHVTAKSISVGYKPNWTNLAGGVSVDANKNLVKTGNNAWDAGASSYNILPKTTASGWIEFAWTNSSAYEIGLSRWDQDVLMTSLEYGFDVINGGDIAIYEHGTAVGTFGRAATGDIFRIVKNGTTIEYYHNGMLLRSLTYPALDADFLVDVSVYHNGTAVPAIYTSFDSRIAIKKTITPVQSATVGGSIQITPGGGMPPYAYSWDVGGTTSQITNKPAGAYKVTVTDAEGRSSAFDIGLGYEIDWTYINAATVQPLSTGAIQRYSATNGWDGGASSLNMLLPNTDGWIEFEIDRATGSYFEIGLSTGDISYSYSGIDNGIMANTDGNVYFFKKSANQGVIGLNRLTDVYRIARETSTSSLKIYRNGVTMYTTAIAASVPQIVDVTVFQGKAPVIYSSFDTRFRVTPTFRPLDSNGGNAAVGLTIAGGVAPYAVSWSTGESGAVLSGKDLGQYTATITDQVGRTFSRPYQTGYPVEWGSLSNTSWESAYTLRKSSSSSGWDAGAFSRNMLAASTSGWIEFVAPAAFGNTLWAIGLSPTNTNVNFTSIGYAFVFGSSNNSIVIYENGILKANAGYWFAGDVFTIKRTPTNAIEYYVNGLKVYTSGIGNSQNLFADASIYTPGLSLPTVMGSFKRELVTIDQKIRNNWAFEYRYDDRQRMSAKKAPGAEWVYMVYDKRDRLVLTQDGNQRPTNEWLYTKYDALNRPVMTGIYKHTGDQSTQEQMQAYVNTQFPDFAVDPNSNLYYEEYDGTATNFGYTSRSFPTASPTPLTITYYDDYQFKGLYSDPRFDFVADHLDGQQTAAFDRTKGQVTGTQMRSLNDGYAWLRSVNYYDDKYRVVQRIEEDHRRKISRHTSIYDFVGKVTETNSTQAQEYDVVWRVSGCQVDNVSNKLICTSTTGWTSGGSSLQVLAAAQDGWVEYVYDGTSTNAVGLSTTDTNYNLTSIQYGAYSQATGKLYALGNGILAFLGDIRKGDVIRIERVKGTVLMRVNGNLFYTFATASTTSLIVDVSLGSGTLEKVRTSFGADKSQVNTLGVAYYTTLGFANNTFTKTATSDAWNGYATSMNVLSGPGWVQFKAVETTKNRMAGLASISPITTYNDLEYAVYLQPSNVFTIREGLQTLYTGSYNAGDIFRIESNGATVTYSRNGQVVPVPTTNQQPPVKSYRFQVAMYSKSSTIAEVALSFGIPMTEQKTDLYSRFEYDHAGRSTKEWNSINNQPEVLLTLSQYNELGQLITKKLYNTDPETTPDANRHFKQETDYRYNIRGWLTRINNSDLTTLDNTSGPKDFFGMELGYEKPLASITDETQVAFNGNISAIRWSNNLGLGGINNPTQRAYRYSYDPMNRLVSASHFEGTPGTTETLWSATNAFSESIIGPSNTSGYDLNGNIRFLQRTGKDGAGIDALTYDYGTDLQRSNKLLAVTDAPNTDADLRNKGFKDGASTALDYSYDPNGNMVSDLNKDVQSITYNHLNLPARVNKTTGEYVRYIYDATGRKLAQQVFDANNVMTKRSDYVGNLFLENDTLKFVNHAEGRIIPGSAKTEAGEYQYHLKDHLGNVRLTFTTKDETETSIATLEPDHEDEDRAKFLYYDEAVKVRHYWFDHTNNANVTEGICTGLGTVDGYATRLTGGNTDAKFGLAQSISVMPGDVVNMEVWAKYVDLSQESPGTPIVNFITTLGSAASISTGTFIDGGVPGSLGDLPMLINPIPHLTSDPGNTGPKAYLNFVFLDRDMQASSTDLGYSQITTDAIEHGQNGCHQKLFLSYPVKQPGYLYIYLSNENPTEVEVFFDDFKVEHIKSPVVQQDDYYPFGLTYNSYQRENSIKQNYQFNGKEIQDELDLGWSDFGARMCNAEIARWNSVDPLADKYIAIGPYVYVADNPTMYIDSNGEEIIFAENSSADFKQTVFNNIQKITNEELELVGDVIRIKENGKPQNSEHNLESGTSLVSYLIGSDQTVTLMEGKKFTTTSSYKWTGVDGESVPTSSEVSIPLNEKRGVVRKDGSRTPGPLWESIGHELGHASLRAQGKSDPSLSDENEDIVDPDNYKVDENGKILDDGTGYIDNEEIQVRKDTNKIVTEQHDGKPKDSELRKEPYVPKR